MSSLFNSHYEHEEQPRRVDSLTEGTSMVGILQAWVLPPRSSNIHQREGGNEQENVRISASATTQDGGAVTTTLSSEASCQSSSQSSSTDSSRRSSYSDRCPSRLSPFTPPDNYAAVFPGQIYRSGYPKEENYAFLKTLRLKSILTLVKDDCSEGYVKFMHDNGIKHFQVHIPANKEAVKITPEVMVEALRVVLDRRNYPLLIHCNKGKHRTGCVVACFKKVLGEQIKAVKEEYHIYAGAKARALDEQFIDSFDEKSIFWLARLQGWLSDDEPRQPLTIRAA